MSQYIPKPAPFGDDLATFRQWVVDELAAIAARTTEGNDVIRFNVLYAPPKKFSAGDTVFADGVRWVPITGGTEGKYRRNAANTAWIKES